MHMCKYLTQWDREEEIHLLFFLKRNIIDFIHFKVEPKTNNGKNPPHGVYVMIMNLHSIFGPKLGGKKYTCWFYEYESKKITL